MDRPANVDSLYKRFIVAEDPGRSNYFGLIKELLSRRNHHGAASKEYRRWQKEIDRVYRLIGEEIKHNQGRPTSPVKFGTSGWRGMIGKDLFCKSVAQVTEAIVSLYRDLEDSDELAGALGVASLEEACRRGAVVGHDNRFGGELLAGTVADVLTGNGFTVHYAGESTTGALSAAVLELGAAFSVNLTPSHNPLEYAGCKYNAADAGPAPAELTNRITARANAIIEEDRPMTITPEPSLVKPFASLDSWISLVRRNRERHRLDFDRIMADFAACNELVVAVDCVHGASRVHIRDLFKQAGDTDRLVLLRADADPTFGGIAPEPSTANLEGVNRVLKSRPEALKLGMIMDPDADRIRFTDGESEIDMNFFGAMAYHFLHEVKGLKGMVAKTVATSNFANSLAAAFGEEVFEPRVGFKEFKPVIDRALVCFEESDGITVIGHTPEKDAYIGLLLALDMVLTRREKLGDYQQELRSTYGRYYPARDGVVVSQQGEALAATLAKLDRYDVGSEITVGGDRRRITRVIDIDGRKMILDDGSWLMIRPSGTEPKVRFYVEARTEEDKEALFTAAKSMLAEIGLLD